MVEYATQTHPVCAIANKAGFSQIADSAMTTLRAGLGKCAEQLMMGSALARKDGTAKPFQTVTPA